MTEPQVWSVIAVLAAVFATMIGLSAGSTRSMGRALGAQIEGLRTEMVLRFERVDERFERVEQRLDRVEVRLDNVEGRLDRLEKRVDDIDRDVQMITRRVMPD